MLIFHFPFISVLIIVSSNCLELRFGSNLRVWYHQFGVLVVGADTNIVCSTRTRKYNVLWGVWQFLGWAWIKVDLIIQHKRIPLKALSLYWNWSEIHVNKKEENNFHQKLNPYGSLMYGRFNLDILSYRFSMDPAGDGDIPHVHPWSEIAPIKEKGVPTYK